MANKIVLKKSSVAAKIPLATDLVVGELAVNLADQKLYTKDAGGTVIVVGSSAAAAVQSVAGKTGVVTLVKGDVGLGNVDNTSDASKPVSTAQQTALNLKANLASPTFTGTPAAPTAAADTNTTQVATTAYVIGQGYLKTTTAASTYQPIDADLTAIAALAGTTGLLRKTAANTWSLDTASYLTANQTVTLSGDASGSGSTAIAVTLANSGVTAGTYTKLTVDAKGRATVGATLASTDIPSLDASKITTGVFDAARLPSYVDDVLEYANLAGFPVTGETGKIYVAIDTNKTYRWSGSAYVYITSGAVDSVGGFTGVVTAGNLLTALLTVDGASSGLDADTLDGNHASAFYLATNPNGYTTNTGTVTSVTGTAPVVSSGGTTPAISMAAATTSVSGYLTSTDWNTFNGKQAALGFTPYNATNPAGYITGITSGMVTTALGYTPYNSSNPSGYITSSGSITGNAATATTASAVPWSGVSSKPSNIMFYEGFTLNADTMSSNSTGFTYAVNAPTVGPIARFSAGGGYDLEINAGYSNTGIHYRTRNGDANVWQAWNSFITSANIGSQSVNYATTAGSATSATSATYLNSSNYISRTGSSGNLNTDFSNTPAGSIRFQGDDSNLANSPGGTWWHYQHLRHSNASNIWGTQVAWGWEDQSNRLCTRNVSGGSWSGWVEYLSTSGRSFSGSLTMTGNVTAYSDERLKTDWKPMQSDFVYQLSKVKSGSYTRTDTKERQAGVSAQGIQKIIPEAVFEDDKGNLSLAYGNAAMVSCVELAKVIEELRAEIAEMKASLGK